MKVEVLTDGRARRRRGLRRRGRPLQRACAARHGLAGPLPRRRLRRRGEIPRIALNLALLKERRILGVFWGEAMRRDPGQHAANMDQLAQWFAAGKLNPPITERVPLAQAAAAIHRLASRHAMGKLVVLPGGRA